MDCDNAMIIPRILGSIIPCNNQWKQPLLKPISTICCQKNGRSTVGLGTAGRDG